ncbi:MAG: anti-sigma F factor [Clostridia bacterium]|nr:anti-sigma F factor [Clostridia bacterium]
MSNYMKLELSALSENESFARSVVAGFCLPLNPTLTELSDIKTAVSEAVTNCVVHGYKRKGEDKTITLECSIRKDEENGVGELHIVVCDNGCGIEDVERAKTPFFTTLEGEERSGMGFTIMQAFMHEFSVESEVGKGTRVTMVKRIGAQEE